MAVNAQVTVAYKGNSVTFDLEGYELSDSYSNGGEIVPGHSYLNTASRGFIADHVEKALKDLRSTTSQGSTPYSRPVYGI